MGYETGEMTGAGMAGRCQMKALSALKSTHTLPFSPSLSCGFSEHCQLALRQHIVHSAERSDEEYIWGYGKGRSNRKKTGKSKSCDWFCFVLLHDVKHESKASRA